jgi:hypothetical protein
MRLNSEIQGKRKGAFIAQMERKRRSHLGQTAKLLRTGLNEQVAPILRTMKTVQSFEELEQAANRNVSKDIMKERYNMIYGTVGVDFAKDTYKNIAPTQKADQNHIEYIWRENMRQYVGQEAANRITLITNTTETEFKRIVRNVVLNAKEQGQSVQDAAAEIQKQIGFNNAYRAVRIARTEIVSASNHGSMVGAKSTGLPLRKTWIATKTGNTRHSHKEMDGKTVDLNIDFQVPMFEGKTYIGEEGLTHPGDVRGSAGNVINCRCTQGYERII